MALVEIVALVENVSLVEIVALIEIVALVEAYSPLVLVLALKDVVAQTFVSVQLLLVGLLEIFYEIRHLFHFPY